MTSTSSAKKAFLTSGDDIWDFNTASGVNLDLGSKVWGRAGSDQITGGQWSDKLFGGLGNDWLYGAAGRDALDGGRNDDNLFGGDGSDMLRGGAGADILVGDGSLDGEGVWSNGTDLGNDKLIGGGGSDILYGGDGNDKLIGGGGLDTLYGGDGDDRLNGGGGSDELHGGAGNDRFSFDSLDDGIDNLADIEASTPAGEEPQIITDVINLSDILGGVDCALVEANIGDYVRIDQDGLWVDADGTALTIDTDADTVADASAEGAYIATGSFADQSYYAVHICDDTTVLVQAVFDVVV